METCLLLNTQNPKDWKLLEIIHGNKWNYGNGNMEIKPNGNKWKNKWKLLEINK